MKALTLWQPWASLVAMSAKAVETRGWKTKYRGDLAIHSSAKLPALGLGLSSSTDLFQQTMAEVFKCSESALPSINLSLPYGSVLCIVKLIDICPVERVRNDLSRQELIFGNYDDGRYAWFMELVELFEKPIPAKGSRMLWNWEGR